MAKLLRSGIYNSRDSLLSIAKTLKYKFGDKDIDLDEIQKLNFQQETEGKNIFADESNTKTEQLTTNINQIINESLNQKDVLVKKIVKRKYR